MALLVQSILSSQLITAPILTSSIQLPPGCNQATLTLNVSPADLAAVKTLNLIIEISLDGGQYWQSDDSPGTTFVFPATEMPQLSSRCNGFDGACLRALLTPDNNGITLDAVVEVD